MKITHKLLLGTLVSILLIWSVGMFATHRSQQALRESIVRSSLSEARAIMNEVDRVIWLRRSVWAAYIRNDLVQETLGRSNLENGARPDLEAYLEEQDRRWREAGTEPLTPFLRGLLRNDLSRDLGRQLAQVSQEMRYEIYGEALLADRYGAVAALTGRTTDFRQDDEEWFQRALERGEYVSDVSYNERARMYSTDICLRVESDGGEPLGVLKVVLNIEEVMDILDHWYFELGDRNRSRLLLFSRDERVVYSSDEGIPLLSEGARFLDPIQRRPSTEVSLTRRHDDGPEMLAAYARSLGHDDFAGLGWTTLVEYDCQSLFGPVQEVRGHMTLIVLAGAVVGLLCGGSFAFSLSRRFRLLSESAREIGSGRLDVSAPVEGKDELAQFARSFHEMASQLRLATGTLEAQAEKLRSKNARLEQEIEVRREIEEQRDRMELDLLHAQKMESIGQMAAGIAHEINTPIQYVGDNIGFLAETFDELIVALRQIMEIAADAEGEAGARRERVDAVEKEADFDYILTEIPSALEQSRDGVRRVAEIVCAMKEFAHPGRQELSVVDINRGIESTLTVARNEYKYVARVETDLDPELPQISCLPGEINQVILNIVTNAAHAIEQNREPDAEELGTIRVQTRRVEDDVEIRISDTGGGIPEEVRDRIFDPFFTTKDVGKGTGQGLAIAHDVIHNKHGGSLTFETELGRGTTFIIRLPMTPAEATTEESA